LPSISGTTLPEILSAALGAASGEASGSEIRSTGARGISSNIPIVAISTGGLEQASGIGGIEGSSSTDIPTSFFSALGGSSNSLGGHEENSVQQEVRRAENETSEATNGKANGVKSEEESKLAEIYEDFDFEPIWERLSQVLTRLRGDPNAAQILLPLIEVSCIVGTRGSTFA
jgi:hypothetical protein